MITAVSRPDAGPFARTIEHLEEMFSTGLRSGCQIYVSRNGKPIIDTSLGDVPSRDDVLIWRCATKPVFALAVAKLWESGVLDISAPLGHYVSGLQPDVGIRSCEEVLRHAVCFRFDPPAESVVPLTWGELTEALTRATTRPPARHRLGFPYSLWVGWSILAALVGAVTRRPVDEFVREEVLLPLGMRDCWIGMPEEAFDRYGERIRTVRDLRPGRDRWEQMRQGRYTASRCSPADGGRGPARQLASVFETLLSGGAPLLSPPTTRRILSPVPGTHRSTRRQTVPTWGLGITCQGTPFPWLLSDQGFGHLSLEHTITFADPVTGVVVVIAFSSMGEPAVTARLNISLVRVLAGDLKEHLDGE